MKYKLSVTKFSRSAKQLISADLRKYPTIKPRERVLPPPLSLCPTRCTAVFTDAASEEQRTCPGVDDPNNGDEERVGGKKRKRYLNRDVCR